MGKINIIFKDLIKALTLYSNLNLVTNQTCRSMWSASVVCVNHTMIQAFIHMNTCLSIQTSEYYLKCVLFSIVPAKTLAKTLPEWLETDKRRVIMQGNVARDTVINGPYSNR